MSDNTLITNELLSYVLSHGMHESPVARKNRMDTSRRRDAGLQIPPEQGAFMALLLRLTAARQGLEIGVYTGYSSLMMAEALPPGGRLLACDIDAETTSGARQYWQAAGVAERIELRIAPALDTLDAEIAAGHTGRYDFAFIDADKSNYVAYYERCLALIRTGGLIMADNTLWHGRVIDMRDATPDTVAIRAFNAQLLDDARVHACLLPIGDGLTLACKR